MIDGLGDSWTAVIASLSFLDELGGAVANPSAWIVFAVIAAAGIYCVWAYIRERQAAASRQETQAMVRAVQWDVRNIHAAVAGDGELDQAITRDLVAGWKMRAIPREEIADKIPASTAKKNARKPKKKNPSKARNIADNAPECVRLFVEQHVVRRPAGKLLPADFHAAYSAWREEQGFIPVSPNKFGRALTDIGGFAKDGRHYLNIALRGSKLKVVRA